MPPSRAVIDGVRRWWDLVPLAAIALVVAQYRHGGGSIVRHHDVLDSHVALMSRVSVGDLVAPPGREIEEILGGLDRMFVGSELHVGTWLLVLLPPVWALLVNEVLIRAIAFFGMRWLLRELDLGLARWIVYVVATLFSLLPFFLMAYGAVAGFPLLLAALHRVYRTGRLDRVSVPVFVLFPLYSELPYDIPYVLVLLLVAGGATLLGGRRSLGPMLQGIALFAAASLVAGWRYLYLAAAGPVSHRTEQVVDDPLGPERWEGIGGSLTDEVSHAAAGRSFVLLLVLGVGLAVLVVDRSPALGRHRRIAAGAIGLVAAGIVIGRTWVVVETHVVSELLPEWGRFQLRRVRWTDPTILYVLLAISLASLARACTARACSIVVPVLVPLFVAVQGWTLVDMHTFRSRPDSLTIDAYYAPRTFDEITEVLADDGVDRVVSVGLHPAVAIFNGIPSADGYWTGYPLEYKHRFRRLIAPALDADEDDREYFDEWGSRAYVFQPELGRPRSGVVPDLPPFDLLVDPAAYDDLGITHVISIAEVADVDESGLAPLAAVGRSDELGTLYVYRVVGADRS